MKHKMSFASKKGTKPGPNQDDFVCIIINTNEKRPEYNHEDIFLGVFDGHGEHGHIISNMVQRLFPKVIFILYYYFNSCLCPIKHI